MNIISRLIDIILHIDKHLLTIVQQYGTFSYVIIFLIIFLETGLVLFPFLPGDSLLFAVGAISSTGGLNIGILLVITIFAAILGDTLNYWIGNVLGPRVFKNENSKWFNKQHLDRTHKFYEKHGGKTVILARFIPIIRTFAPFVAGIGKMNYWRFLLYNILGGVVWVSLFVLGGYFFGSIPWVQNNFGVAIVIIVVVSLIPIGVEYWKHKRNKAHVI